MRRPLGVMTWNVRYFGHGLAGLRSTYGWMQKMAEGVAALDPLPDVIALQEVETRSWRAGNHPDPQLDRFLACLNEALEERGQARRFRGLYFPAHQYSFGNVGALYTTGLAILVADQVEVHETHTIHDITHVRLAQFERLKQRRIAAHVRLRFADTGDWLDLFNTHFSLPAFFEVGPHRIPDGMGHGTNQMREAQRLMRFVRKHAGPNAVIVGDLNTLPGSPVYRAFKKAGLADAFAETRNMDLDALLGWGTARFLHRRMHIDHVFSTPSVRWVEFADHHIDSGPLVGLSDHAPKLGWLRP